MKHQTQEAPINVDTENSHLISGEQLPAVTGFVTSKGSVYRYTGEGQTSRHRTVTGEDFIPSDITVFVTLDPYTEIDYLVACRKKLPNRDVWIVEEQDGWFRTVMSLNDVGSPNKLHLVIVDNKEIIKSTLATLEAGIGTIPFELGHQFDDQTGEALVYKHMGSEVVELLHS